MWVSLEYLTVSDVIPENMRKIIVKTREKKTYGYLSKNLQDIRMRMIMVLKEWLYIIPDRDHSWRVNILW